MSRCHASHAASSSSGSGSSNESGTRQGTKPNSLSGGSSTATNLAIGLPTPFLTRVNTVERSRPRSSGECRAVRRGVVPFQQFQMPQIAMANAVRVAAGVARQHSTDSAQRSAAFGSWPAAMSRGMRNAVSTAGLPHRDQAQSTTRALSSLAKMLSECRYFETVKLYWAEYEKTLRSALTQVPLLPALREVLVMPAQLGTVASDPQAPHGCVMGNTVAELVPHDAEASTLVTDAFARFADVMIEPLRQARERGEVSTASPPEAQA